MDDATDDARACARLARIPSLTVRDVRAAMASTGSLGGAAARCGAHDPGETPSKFVIDADLTWLRSSGATVIPCTSPAYPPLLAATVGAPPVLFVLGDPAALALPQIAMVGARGATPTGRAIARELAHSIASAGLCVTSGLALGIDGASHEGALAARGATIAVCAHGLDELYPRAHAGLARRIREQGALVSPYPPGTPARRARFPRRNRILSGLARATLVVEAARASGSLLTARSAMRQGRPVFAVPGSIVNPLAAGCLELLREGAKVADSASRVLEALGILPKDHELAAQPGGPPSACDAPPVLDKDGEILLDALGFEPVGLDALAERTGLDPSSAASILLMLELQGRVALDPGRRYCRLT
ncbi:MAG: DNA-processing protein DprA [Steroidobacteraceae bacterium]